MTIENPSEILANMRTLVAGDILLRGSYFEPPHGGTTEEIRVCEGERACAIGTLWLAAGERRPSHDRYARLLPGVTEPDRPAYVATRPGLKLALSALNEAADEYAANSGKPYFEDWAEYASEEWDDNIEGFFEGTNASREDMLAVIEIAQGKVAQ